MTISEDSTVLVLLVYIDKNSTCFVLCLCMNCPSDIVPLFLLSIMCNLLFLPKCLLALILALYGLLVLIYRPALVDGQCNLNQSIIRN